MKWRISEHLGAGVLAAAVGLGALGTACTDANESLTIVQAQIPDESCKIGEEDTGGERRIEGILDLALDRAYGYTLYPLVANNLPTLGMVGTFEPNRISITGVEIKIVPPPGLNITWPQGCEPTFDDTSTVNLNPTERRVLSVQAMRACHAQVVRDLFVKGDLDSSLAEKIKFRVVVRAHGRHGGTDIKSDPFDFPIRVCYGCLQTGFAGPYADFSFAVTPPKILACDRMAENPYRGNPCNPAQDVGPILCCAEDAKGEKLLCPGIPRAKPGAP